MIATPFFSPSIPLIAAPPTPLTADGSLNLAAVEKQATQLAADGVSGVFIGGTTGESASLTLEERQQLAARWCEVLHRSSLRRIIHVGSNCLADACRLADQARKLQADGIAAVAPCYFRPTDTRLLVDCCAQIAAAAPELPFYYYEIPSITGIHLPTDRFLSEAMERIPSFGGLKYSNSDLPLLQRCVAIAAGRLELFLTKSCSPPSGLERRVRWGPPTILPHRSIDECWRQQPMGILKRRGRPNFSRSAWSMSCHATATFRPLKRCLLIGESRWARFDCRCGIWGQSR